MPEAREAVSRAWQSSVLYTRFGKVPQPDRRRKVIMMYHTNGVTGNASTETSAPPMRSGSPAALAHGNGLYADLLNTFRAERHFGGRWRDLAVENRIGLRALQALHAGYYPATGDAKFLHARLPEAESAGGEFVALPTRNADNEVVGLHLWPVAGGNDLTVG